MMWLFLVDGIKASNAGGSTTWKMTLPPIEAAQFDAAISAHREALMIAWKRDHHSDTETSVNEADRRYLLCDASAEVWFERDDQPIGAGRSTRQINRRLRPPHRAPENGGLTEEVGFPYLLGRSDSGMLAL